MKHVVFDIGAVLVDWQPHLAWSDELGDDGARAFMDRVDFMALNKRADNGERFADLAEEIADPEDRARFATYVERYARTVVDAVPGTWAVLDRLKAKDVPIHAITNWSAETWPEGLKVHPRLDDVFGTLVVSGREHISKPDARIFQILCERAEVPPHECVFIDDGPHNVEGAKAVGMDAIHFTGAKALEKELMARNLL
ncbi:MAG: HAD family phosphatase [Pseudomonadota bacterium]